MQDSYKHLIFVSNNVMLMSMAKYFQELKEKLGTLENSAPYLKFLNQIFIFGKQEPLKLLGSNLFVDETCLYFVPSKFLLDYLKFDLFNPVKLDEDSRVYLQNGGSLKISNYAFMEDYFCNNPNARSLLYELKEKSLAVFKRDSKILVFPSSFASFFRDHG